MKAIQLLAGLVALSPVLAGAADITVTTSDDAGPNTLRQAILAANATPAADVIRFNIGAGGVQKIVLASPLPTITAPVLIDGRTQPGYAGKPLIQIDGALAGTGNGLTIAAGFSIVRGLSVTKFSGAGIELQSKGSNLVYGNYVGVTPAGGVGGNSQDGLRIVSPAGTNSIGIAKPAPEDRNVICSNGSWGVRIDGPYATNNVVRGNWIGVMPGGASKRGNGVGGVGIFGSQRNVIGAPARDDANVISGNHGPGIDLEYTQHNVVLGNRIGTDPTGLKAMGNQGPGVRLFNAWTNTIGTNNVISANTEQGIHSTGLANYQFGNIIRGNFIGTDETGVVPLGNLQDGILLHYAPEGYFIGGTSASRDGNRIAFNGGHGVRLLQGGKIAILGNSIFANGGLGISLTGAAPTPNDSGDPDAGPNELQNYPKLTQETKTSSGVQIQGSLNGKPGKAYRLEFFANTQCDPSGFGEGEYYLGYRHVGTDAGGNVSFTFGAPALDPKWKTITATATDSDNNTSEFSRCFVRGLITITHLPDSGVTLSWPVDLLGYRVEYASAVAPRLVRGVPVYPTWTELATRPQIVGDQYQIALPASSAQQFFRLVTTDIGPTAPLP